MPFWAWILLASGVFVCLFVWNGRAYQRKLQSEFLAWLRDVHPELAATSKSPSSVDVRAADGYVGTLALRPLYRQMAEVTDEEGRRELFARYVVAFEEGHAAAKLDVDRDRPRLLPRIIRDETLRELGNDPPLLAVGVNGLWIAFILDSPNSVSYVSRRDLEQLASNEYEAYVLAKKNLGRKFNPEAVRQAAEGSIVVIKTFDSHDATRLLLVPELLDEGVELAAAIPDRDTLMLTRAPEDGDWSMMRKLALNNESEPFWTKPLRVTREGIRSVT